MIDYLVRDAIISALTNGRCRTHAEYAEFSRAEAAKPREVTARFDAPTGMDLGDAEVPAVIAWLQDVWAQVPEEHRGGARFRAELDTVHERAHDLAMDLADSKA